MATTPEAFGPLVLPVTTGATMTQFGDPSLDLLGDFLKAAVNDSASNAWGALMPGVPACREVFLNDPEELDFNEKYLPSLFVWRARGFSEQIADDYLDDHGTIFGLWIFPTASQAMQGKRGAFINAIWKSILAAVFRERTPGWTVAGDTDPRAATEGSFLGTYLRQWRLVASEGRDGQMVEVTADAKRTYSALRMQFELQEILDLGTEHTDASAGGQFAVNNVTGRAP
jgi:hypothetical protein